MRRNVKRVSWLLILLVVVLPAFAAPQNRAKLSEGEIKIRVKNPDCEGVDIDHVEYFDFTGDGIDEAVVVASTCATGTAGPDVHTVLSRQPDGSIAELKIPEPTEKQMAVLFGPVFYELTVKDGLLIGTYNDESGRRDPLVVKYRWDVQSKSFGIVELKSASRYKASFDCDKAKTEIENAICYSSTAASLDLALNLSYKTWLDNLNDAQSDILMKEQKDWLRKRGLICGNDRQIMFCLETLYRARILEVQQFKRLHP